VRVTSIPGAIAAIAGLILLAGYLHARAHTLHAHVHAHPGAHPHSHVHRHAAGEHHGHSHRIPLGRLFAALLLCGAGAWMLASGFGRGQVAIPQSLVASAFTVFALGLRHGADPDHLAAIDNMTRNSSLRAPALSRFIGTIFAGGHTIMVLAVAAFVGYLGTRFAAHSTVIETAGTLISISLLFAIAALNVRQLALGQTGRLAGAKTRLIPAVLRNAASPWAALPVGLLFGFGFETSSQVAAYAVAFGAGAGIAGALIVGAMFCVGMMCTDTLDSLFIHHLVTYRSGHLPRLMRVWIWAVTILAVAVATYESAQLLGWKLPVSELGVSAILVAGLLGVFTWIFVAMRRTEGIPDG
jgi:high-affinity nickel-transport protein